MIGFDVDPKQTPLRDVMTQDPATLSIDDSEQRAIELMRDRHVRRIPIIDGDRIAGIVTLDDLILSRALDRQRAALLVRRVGAALGELVSAGEIQHVVDQLPRAMKEIFAHPA